MLSQAALLKKNYEQIAYLTGRNFNIFDVLGLSKKEVKTHSAFLAELLNPEGSHGQRDKYLSLFVDRLSLEKPFKSEDATVYCEKYIGPLSDDGKSGGRIDLLIENKNGQQIIIENKIYASDQPNQLLRYNNRYSKAELFYLTLKGGKPSDASLGGESFQVETISYDKDIIPWLELCMKESASLPVIRETLHQYINLIKNLTGQTIMNEMSSEIQELILAEQGLKALKDCQSAASDLYKKVGKRFKDAAQKGELDLKKYKFSFGKKEYREVLKVNGAELRVIIAEDDRDGIWIGYMGFEGEKTHNAPFSNALPEDYESRLKDAIERSLSSDLKDKPNVKIYRTKWHFIWFNPAPFECGEKVNELSDEKVYEAHKNDKYLDTLVDEIRNQEAASTKELLSMLQPK